MAARRQECSICIDSFKSPKLISCHHSFCFKCLEDYVRTNLRNGRFDCPICRASVELPNEGCIGFPSNFYIDTDSGGTFTCDICGPESIACFRCLDCEENLCQMCSRVHQKSKATKHHKISDLGTLDPEMKGKIRQRIFCVKHPEEEIKLVCQKCKVTMCVLCKVLNHDTHASKTVADAAAELQQRLEAKLYQCAEKLKRLDVCAQTGDELERKINDAEREELKAFEEHYSELLKILDLKAANMKDKIKSIYGELRNENAAFKADVQNETQKCSKANASARKLIDQGTHIEKIQKVPDLERLISEVNSKSDPEPIPSVMRKLFSPAAMMPTELSSLIGVVQDSIKVSPEENKNEEWYDDCEDDDDDEEEEIDCKTDCIYREVEEYDWYNNEKPFVKPRREQRQEAREGQSNRDWQRKQGRWNRSSDFS